jgi:hypothetical protein
MHVPAAFGLFDENSQLPNRARFAPKSQEGGYTVMRKLHPVCLSLLLLCVAIGVASAQSFRVQCPTTTTTHPAALHDNNSEPAYTGPTTLTGGANGYRVPSANVNGAIKCQQIYGGDGYSTMGDGTQT